MSNPRHGTLTGYTTDGCRCGSCRAAMAEYMRRRRALQRGPDYQPRVPVAKPLCEALGITHRQLDYWCLNGYVQGVETSGPGHPRIFTDEQIARLASLAQASRLQAMNLDELADWITTFKPEMLDKPGVKL